jgi:N-methylhydantoinase B
MFTAWFGRSKFAARGAAGGRSGMSNYFIVERNAGAPQRLSKAAALRLARGDVVHIHTGSGGGFGDPLERDPESVARDVRETFASADRAISTAWS